MTESEREMRSRLAWQIGPEIGEAIPNVVKVIHHSSTRKPEGPRPDSDIDLTLIIDNYLLAYTNVGREMIESNVAKILNNFNLELGTGPMQVHITRLSEEAMNDPSKFMDKKFIPIVTEILDRGEVVYTKRTIT